MALTGAIVARFRPAGMALAMNATALAQTFVAVFSSIYGLGSRASIWSPEVPVLTVFFVALW